MGRIANDQTREEVLAANRLFVAHHRPDLTARPARALAVVTCMDARLDPAAFLGLEAGDAHVLRNAGGQVTDDVLRSLAISHHVLGTRQAFVIGHTDCGLLGLGNDTVRRRIGAAAADIDFMPFADLADRIRESVQAIEASPLLPETFAVSGFVYDVETGRLSEVT
jgi:carbonic anhydrase